LYAGRAMKKTERRNLLARETENRRKELQERTKVWRRFFLIYNDGLILFFLFEFLIWPFLAVFQLLFLGINHEID
jgi:hypothetical protein